VRLLGRALREMRADDNDPTSPLHTARVADVLVGGGYLRADQAHSLLVLASATHTIDIEARGFMKLDGLPGR
jgi:hypothetical protein